jgi:hypothetical protein
MLRILRESNGGAIGIGDEEMIRVSREVGAAKASSLSPKARVFRSFETASLRWKNRFRLNAS